MRPRKILTPSSPRLNPTKFAAIIRMMLRAPPKAMIQLYSAWCLSYRLVTQKASDSHIGQSSSPEQFLVVWIALWASPRRVISIQYRATRRQKKTPRACSKIGFDFRPKEHKCIWRRYLVRGYKLPNNPSIIRTMPRLPKVNCGIVVAHASNHILFTPNSVQHGPESEESPEDKELKMNDVTAREPLAKSNAIQSKRS